MGDAESARAESLLRGVTLVPVGEDLLLAAGWAGAPALRSLDAIHLATATAISDDLGAIFSYDDRLCDAAGERGIRVERPR